MSRRVLLIHLVVLGFVRPGSAGPPLFPETMPVAVLSRVTPPPVELDPPVLFSPLTMDLHSPVQFVPPPLDLDWLASAESPESPESPAPPGSPAPPVSHPDGVLDDPKTAWPYPSPASAPLHHRILAILSSLHSALVDLNKALFSQAEPSQDETGRENTTRVAHLLAMGPHGSWSGAHYFALSRHLLSLDDPVRPLDDPSVTPPGMPDSDLSDVPGAHHVWAPTPPGEKFGLHYSTDENGFYDAGPDDELPPVPLYLKIR